MFPHRSVWIALLFASTVAMPLSAKPTGDSAAYRKTLDANAKDETAFKNLLRSLKPGETRDDLGRRFSKLAEPGKAFNAMTEECRRNRDAVALEQIANAMKEMNPQQPGVDAILLRAKLANGKIADATALFRAAAKATKDPLVQKGLRDEFLQGMANAGKAIDAYRAFPGGKESFHVLADQLSANGNARALRELIEEHQVFLGDDPYLSLYAGQLFYQAGQFADADTAWTTAFKAIKNVEIEERYQRRWFRARLAVGKAFDGADESLSAKSHVTQLANELLACGKIDELEKLLQAYAKAPEHDAKMIIEYRLRMNRNADFATLAKIAEGLADGGRGYVVTETHIFWAESGKALDVYQAATDKKSECYSLGNALFIRRKFADLRRFIEAHRKVEPTDPMATVLEAAMWLEQGHPEKVIAALKNLQVPAEAISSYQVKSLLRDAHIRLGLGLKYYKEYESGLFGISELAVRLASNRNAADLEALFTQPENGKVTLNRWQYHAKAKIFAGKPNEAIAIYLPYRDEALKQIALQPKQPKKKAADPFGGFGGFGGKKKAAPGRSKADRETDKTDRKLQTFQRTEADLVREMARIGHGLEMYRLAAFPDKAFATLATSYRNEKNVDALEKLLAEHRRKHPADEDLPLPSAYVALWRGDLSRAVDICRCELAKPSPEPEDKTGFGALFGRTQKPYQFRECLLTALVHQGKTLEQYRLYGNDYAAFHRMAGICVREKEADELEALLSVHRKSVPHDPGLRLYEAELNFLRGNYDAAAKTFLSVNDRNDDQRGKGLISLVRAKRFEEAVRLAKVWEADAPLHEPIPTVLAYAAAGDLKETVRLLAMHSRIYDHLERFYADENLGPLLRSDALKSVRERYPDPRKK